MTVRRVRPDEWEQLREIRVRALEDSPDSFRSTATEAHDRDDADWRAWAQAGGSSPQSAVFVAVEGSRMVGLCGSFLREHEPHRAQIVAMWVDPDFRGRGLAEQLLDAASAWSTASGAHELVLDVTETNHAARRLYERSGFRETGAKAPLRPNASLLTWEMRMTLSERARQKTALHGRGR